jgi:uncharacterized protein involved in cysteine biosynthesis
MTGLSITGVFTALLLALRQLADPRVLRVLGKSLAVSLLLCAAIGWGGWLALDWALAGAGLEDTLFAGASGLRAVVALLATLLGLWLLWRIVALAVVQFFADDVVQAVELRHYPRTAGLARDLSVGEQLRAGGSAALRALLVNLAALPFAVVLLATGVGTPLLFLAVNAVLLGRELHDMVWMRHRHRQEVRRSDALGRGDRTLLGLVVAVMLSIPGLNLLAPVIGAAAATHLIHRRVPDARNRG